MADQRQFRLRHPASGLADPDETDSRIGDLAIVREDKNSRDSN
jgi:hypothetical protein